MDPYPSRYGRGSGQRTPSQHPPYTRAPPTPRSAYAASTSTRGRAPAPAASDSSSSTSSTCSSDESEVAARHRSASRSRPRPIPDSSSSSSAYAAHRRTPSGPYSKNIAVTPPKPTANMPMPKSILRNGNANPNVSQQQASRRTTPSPPSRIPPPAFAPSELSFDGDSSAVSSSSTYSEDSMAADGRSLGHAPPPGSQRDDVRSRYSGPNDTASRRQASASPTPSESSSTSSSSSVSSVRHQPQISQNHQGNITIRPALPPPPPPPTTGAGAAAAQPADQPTVIKPSLLFEPQPNILRFPHMKHTPLFPLHDKSERVVISPTAAAAASGGNSNANPYKTHQVPAPKFGASSTTVLHDGVTKTVGMISVGPPVARPPGSIASGATHLRNSSVYQSGQQQPSTLHGTYDTDSASGETVDSDLDDYSMDESPSAVSTEATSVISATSNFSYRSKGSHRRSRIVPGRRTAFGRQPTRYGLRPGLPPTQAVVGSPLVHSARIITAPNPPASSSSATHVGNLQLQPMYPQQQQQQQRLTPKPTHTVHIEVKAPPSRPGTPPVSARERELELELERERELDRQREISRTRERQLEHEQREREREAERKRELERDWERDQARGVGYSDAERDFRGQMMQMEGELQSLRERHALTDRELQGALGQIQSLQHEVGQVEHAREQERMAMDKLRRVLAEKTDYLHDLQNQLGSKEAELAMLRRMSEDAQRKENAAAATDPEAVQKHKETVVELQETIATLTKKVGELEEELAGKGDVSEETKNLIESLEKARDELQEKYRKLEVEAALTHTEAMLKEKLTATEIAMKTMEIETREAIRGHEEISEKLQETRDTVARLEGELAQTQERERSLEAAKEALTQETERLQADLEALQAAHADLERQRTDVVGERDNLRQLVAGLREERERILEAKDALQAEKDTLLPENVSLFKERDRLIAERDTFQTERDALQQMHDEKAETLDQLRTDLDKLGTDLDSTRAELAKTAELNTALEKLVENLTPPPVEENAADGEPTVADLQVQIAALASAQQQLQAEKASLEAQLAREAEEEPAPPEWLAEKHSLEEQCEAAQTRARQADDEVAQMAVANRKAQNEIAELRAQLTLFKSCGVPKASSSPSRHARHNSSSSSGGERTSSRSRDETPPRQNRGRNRPEDVLIIRKAIEKGWIQFIKRADEKKLKELRELKMELLQAGLSATQLATSDDEYEANNRDAREARR